MCMAARGLAIDGTKFGRWVPVSDLAAGGAQLVPGIELRIARRTHDALLNAARTSCA